MLVLTNYEKLLFMRNWRKEDPSLDLLQIVKMDNLWRWDPKVNQGLEGTETQASCDWGGGISCLRVTDVQAPSPATSVSPRASKSIWTPGFSWSRFILPSHWYVHSTYTTLYHILRIVPETHSTIAFVDALWETMLENYDWPWYIETFRRFKWFLSTLRSNICLWHNPGIWNLYLSAIWISALEGTWRII